MRTILSIFSFFLLTSVLFAQNNNPGDEKNWPHWRGPFANGISLSDNPPLEWSEEKNIKWKIEIPGLGHSTPIIWGDQLIYTTAVSKNGIVETEKEPEQPQQSRRRGMRSKKSQEVHKFLVFSVNRKTSKKLWETTVTEEIPLEGTHQTGSWASNSALTDGKNIYVYFGSRGLFCLDMNGKIKWERDFGQMEKHMEFGEGSSPVLYKDKIIVLWDHKGDSFIIALDKNSGKDVWKVDRDEETSWSTPFVVEVNGKTQVVTNATNRIRSYDFSTGDLIWECTGMTRNVIPMPVSKGNMLYITSGFRGSALFAIDLTKAKGDITGTEAIVWQYNQNTPYTPSPLLVNELLYFLKVNSGILTCLNAKNGEVYYSNKRLEGFGNIYSSPVSVQDRVYITSLTGNTFVIKQGPEFEILAKNKLDDSFSASLVVIDNILYLRGNKYLYCISE